MLASAIQPCTSAITIHTPSSPSLLPLLPSHPSPGRHRALHWAPLCCTVTSQQLSALHFSAYTCWCCFPLCPTLSLYICVSIPSLQVSFNSRTQELKWSRWIRCSLKTLSLCQSRVRPAGSRTRHTLSSASPSLLINKLLLKAVSVLTIALSWSCLPV